MRGVQSLVLSANELGQGVTHPSQNALCMLAAQRCRQLGRAAILRANYSRRRRRQSCRFRRLF